MLRIEIRIVAAMKHHPEQVELFLGDVFRVLNLFVMDKIGQIRLLLVGEIIQQVLDDGSVVGLKVLPPFCIRGFLCLCVREIFLCLFTLEAFEALRGKDVERRPDCGLCDGQERLDEAPRCLDGERRGKEAVRDIGVEVKRVHAGEVKCLFGGGQGRGAELDAELQEAPVHAVHGVEALLYNHDVVVGTAFRILVDIIPDAPFRFPGECLEFLELVFFAFQPRIEVGDDFTVAGERILRDNAAVDLTPNADDALVQRLYVQAHFLDLTEGERELAFFKLFAQDELVD